MKNKNGLVGDQEKIDVAAPFGEITGADFSKLRKMQTGGPTTSIFEDPLYEEMMKLRNKMNAMGDMGPASNDYNAMKTKANELAQKLNKTYGTKMSFMGGGSIDEKMKYGGGGDIMIKTVEISMKVPEKQKRGTGAAMSGTKFSGTY